MINERDFNINYSRTKSEYCFCFFEPMACVHVGQSGKTMLIMNAKGNFSWCTAGLKGNPLYYRLYGYNFAESCSWQVLRWHEWQDTVFFIFHTTGHLKYRSN